MVGEQALTVGSTRINWRQGTIVSSTQETHFAIQGDGFFAVADLRSHVSGSTGTVTKVNDDFVFDAGSTAEGKVYLTRNGEFRFALVPSVSATDPILVDNNGMAVLSDDLPVTLGNYKFIFKSSFDLPSDPTFTTIGKERPSVFQPDYDTAINGTLVNAIDYQQLKYSEFGSGYYVAPTANSIKPIINGSNDVVDTHQLNGPSSGSMLLEKSLEASNTSTERNITHLSMLGKIYNGFVQLIKVYNSNTDEVLGFIR
jgi:flagellar basal body rod protein FlgG